jgi:hypothetical protein
MDELTDISDGMSTRQLACILGVTPEGIRVRLCKTGSYYGLQPARFPNNRLIWPSDSKKRLLEAGRNMKPRVPPGPTNRRRSGEVER